jgi:hypothetical protein
MVKVSPPKAKLLAGSGGICYRWRFYILQTIISPPILLRFEHEIGSGGGSGDSGGFIPY